MINIKKYVRVLQVARKPSKDEFSASAKISFAGLLIIGAIGFAVFLLMVFLSALMGA